MKRHFFVLAAVFFSIRLSAQDSTGQLMDEAVVTASKYPRKTTLTGKVVTIISREQLERSAGKDLSQLLTEQAGIYIAGANSNTGKEKSIYLRGAGSEHTLITIDGVPVYDPSGIGSNFDIRNLPLQHIERIEILKGSQSTLYGSDAVAGVINIITKKSGTGKLNGDLTGSYGSYETFRGSTGITGRSGNFDYQASYALQDTRGINEAVKNPNIPVTDFDGFNQHSFRAGAGYRPHEKIQLRPFFRYSNIRGAIDQGAFTDELDYTYTQNSWQAGVRNEFVLKKSRLHFLYSYNHISRVYTDDSVKSRNGFDTWSQGRYEGGEQLADCYIHIPLRSGLHLSAGADWRHSGSDQQYSSIGAWGPFKSDYSRDSLRQSQWGIYGALNWGTAGGFNAETGCRLNFHTVYGSHAVFNFNPSILLKKKWKFFANLSSAYRTPSLYQLFSEYGNRELKPESAITAETGVQYYSGDEKFTTRALFYTRKTKDILFFATDPVTFRSKYINQDRQHDHGLEWEATYFFTRDVVIKAYYHYVSGNIKTRSGGKDTTYNNLLRRPASGFGVNLSARLSKRFHVNSNLLGVGKRKDVYFDNSTFTRIPVRLGAYALWDLYAEYRLAKKGLKLFAEIRNITNSRYTEISGFNTQGVNGYGGLKYAF